MSSAARIPPGVLLARTPASGTRRVGRAAGRRPGRWVRGGRSTRSRRACARRTHSAAWASTTPRSASCPHTPRVVPTHAQPVAVGLAETAAVWTTTEAVGSVGRCAGTARSAARGTPRRAWGQHVGQRGRSPLDGDGHPRSSQSVCGSPDCSARSPGGAPRRRTRSAGPPVSRKSGRCSRRPEGPRSRAGRAGRGRRGPASPPRSRLARNRASGTRSRALLGGAVTQAAHPFCGTRGGQRSAVPPGPAQPRRPSRSARSRSARGTGGTGSGTGTDCRSRRPGRPGEQGRHPGQVGRVVPPGTSRSTVASTIRCSEDGTGWVVPGQASTPASETSPTVCPGVPTTSTSAPATDGRRRTPTRTSDRRRSGRRGRRRRHDQGAGRRTSLRPPAGTRVTPASTARCRSGTARRPEAGHRGVEVDVPVGLLDLQQAAEVARASSCSGGMERLRRSCGSACASPRLS